MFALRMKLDRETLELWVKMHAYLCQAFDAGCFPDFQGWNGEIHDNP